MGRVLPARWYRKRAQLHFNLLYGSVDIYSQKELYEKNQENEQSYQIIGITSATLVDKCRDANALTKDDLTHTIFDITTRKDSARILLTNSTGATRYLSGCMIYGKLIIRYSGKDGFIHDSFVDYESIRKNGERKLEIGNNFICLKTQVEKIADYHAKFNRGPKHIYSLTLAGTRHYYEPGEWYTLNLNITTAGIDEYMDMKCRCMSVSIERSSDGLGTTEVILEEVIENWTFDSNSVARFLLSGNLSKLPTKEKMIVAASDFDGVADYYCDGTADEVELNKAIVFMAGRGGGIVEFTEGKFVTAAAISLKGNVVFQGRGWNSIIEKNGDFHGIHINGSSGSEIENVQFRNFKIQKADADTNSKDLIHADYANNLIMDSVWCYKPKDQGTELLYCENPIITKCHFTDSISGAGLYIYTSPTNTTMATVIANHAKNNATAGFIIGSIEDSAIAENTALNNSVYGICLNTVNLSGVVGNICKDNGGGANEGGIVIITCDNNVISGNVCEGNNADGIHIHESASDRNVVTGNRATGNTTNNFVDNGTATTDSGNDWN